MDINDSIRKHAEEKTSKLPRFYDKVNEVEVVVDGNAGGGKGVEIIARGEHNKFFIASETGEDIFSCIDSAIHKLEKQLRRTKTKERNKKHLG